MTLQEWAGKPNKQELEKRKEMEALFAKNNSQGYSQPWKDAAVLYQGRPYTVIDSTHITIKVIQADNPPYECLEVDKKELSTPTIILTKENFMELPSGHVWTAISSLTKEDCLSLYNELTGKQEARTFNIHRKLQAVRDAVPEDPSVIETLASILKDSADYFALGTDSPSRSADVSFTVGLTRSTLYFDDGDHAVGFKTYLESSDLPDVEAPGPRPLVPITQIVLRKRPDVVRGTSLNTKLGSNALPKPNHTTRLSSSAGAHPRLTGGTSVIRRLPKANAVQYKGKRGLGLQLVSDGLTVQDWLASAKEADASIDKSFLTFYVKEGLVTVS